MRRQAARFAAFILTLALAGCSSGTAIPARTAPDVAPTVVSPGAPNPAPPKTDQAAAAPKPTPDDLASFLQEKAAKFGDLLNGDYTGTAAEWVGLDEANRLVVGGLVEYPGVNKTGKASAWFSDPDVSRVLLREKWKQPAPGQTDTISALSRQRFQQGPRSPSEAEWQRSVDLFGEELAALRPAPWEKQHEGIRDWLKERLGDRMVKVGFDPKPRPTVSIQAKASGRTEAERVVEVAVLTGFLVTTSGTMTVEVEYVDASASKHFVFYHVDLFSWARESGDPKNLAANMQIDGKSSYPAGSREDLLPKTHPDLAGTLALRAQLTESLPKGAQLNIGLMGSRPFPTVELTVADGQTWEQVWSSCSGIVDQVFAKAPRVFNIDLIVRRGGEAEYFRVGRDRWVVRSFLTNVAKVKLAPETLKSIANPYRRFKTGG